MFKRVLATVLSAVMAITPATAIQAKAHKSHLYPAAGIVRAAARNIANAFDNLLFLITIALLF